MKSITEKGIKQLFNDFNKLKVLVVGDVMVDAYYFGEVTRISPEAPVPIVDINRKSNHLGGAANVALNMASLGCQTWVASVMGNDSEGKFLSKTFQENNIKTEGLLASRMRRTTVKTRVIGNNIQLLRVDEEEREDLNENDTNLFLKKIENLVDEIKFDLIVFEDYNKGVLYQKTIESIIKLANENGILTAVDPKKNNFFAYKNTSLFKPNLKELREGLGIEIDKNDIKSLQKAVQLLEGKLKNHCTLLTLSENGMLIGRANDFKHEKAHKRDIADVSGAGDTVISVAACCLALKSSLDLTIFLANISGGLVCEKVGVVPIEKQALLNEALSLLEKNQKI